MKDKSPKDFAMELANWSTLTAMFIKAALGMGWDQDKESASSGKLVQFTKGNGVMTSLKAMQYFSRFQMK